MPVFAEGAVDPDLLTEGARSLRDYFERQGYFEAEVDYKTSDPPSPDESKAEKKDESKKDSVTPVEQVITYTIDRGRHLRMAGVSFDGQKYFGSSQLQSQLGIVPASFDSPGRYSRRLLESDVNALKNLYGANGFLEASVTDDIEQDYHGKKGRSVCAISY